MEERPPPPATDTPETSLAETSSTTVSSATVSSATVSSAIVSSTTPSSATPSSTTTDLAEEVAGACACFRLRQAARVVTRGYDEAMRGLDLKITQLTMLAAVAIGRERATLSDLAENLGMDRSTFSRNLGPLERRGLVELSAEGRHRARTVRLTAAGGALLEEAVPRWRTAQEQLRARLGAETLDQLKTQLERVAGGV